MRIDHDVHVHTCLSSCSHDPSMTAAAVVAKAAELGLRTVGIADHMWDAAVDGASDWYRPQDAEHVLQTRRLLPAETLGVRVLVGCETEYCGGGKFGIAPATAERFDFVLIPHSHFHMRGFTVPAELEHPDDIARLLVRRFNEVVASGLATGIPHPFLALGVEGRLPDVLSRISDEQFADCFGRAAEAGVSMELHIDMFGGCGRQVPYGDEPFRRVMSLAKRAGCTFHFASDAHALDDMPYVKNLAGYADALGITADDIHPLFR